MARERIGPYMERLPDTDGHGRHRETWRNHLPSTIISDTLSELVNLDGKASLQRHPYGVYDGRLIGEIEDVVRGERIPADDILNDWFLHTDFEHWQKHHSRWFPRPYPNRILLDAHITSAGNLSVRFSTQCLRDDGRWGHAPEWRSIPFFGHADIMKRPNDEVMFIRGVDRLFADDLDRRGRYRSGWSPDEKAWISAACKAVNMAFWLVHYRLSNRFEVHLGRYVTMLTTKPYLGECIGLEIVDALEEHRDLVRSQVRAFKRNTGHAPQHFWDVCKATTMRRTSGSASKVLRGRSGPSADLTLSVIERYLDQLERAVRYGFWEPKETVDAGAEEEREGSPPVRISPEPTGRLASDPEPVFSSVLEDAALWPDLLNIPPRVRQVPKQKPRDPLDPPAYDGLRQAKVPEDVRAEFGVTTARELVERLNAAWRERGRAPIPQGSFPSDARKLRFVVAELRKAMGESGGVPPGSTTG